MSQQLSMEYNIKSVCFQKTKNKIFFISKVYKWKLSSLIINKRYLQKNDIHWITKKSNIDP